MYFDKDKKHYYEIDIVCANFSSSVFAMDYLTGVIGRSSPDYFHWVDIEIANSLRELENKKLDKIVLRQAE